jgi:DNA invertase Pin-like site-specific DNA recombinase
MSATQRGTNSELREDLPSFPGDKVQAWHRDRLAVVYVRQSTLQQVRMHQESTRRQYALTNRVHALGWPSAQIEVIDEDQGKSAASSAGRAGFQRLVSEVSLNHVGLIMGLELSRLARSNTDWHQLLELCALFGTLIADLDGIYDPAQYNDRLLLGLKGTLSEAELHVLRQRLQQGRLNKARRGELLSVLPTGYVRDGSSGVRFDPDEQVQHVVRLIFRKFAELGTIHAVLRYLVKHHIEVGMRRGPGITPEQLGWRRPNRGTLLHVLKNPLYAGAYAYGRRQADPRRRHPGRPATGRVVCDPSQWQVLLKDRFPAYISWEQYEENRARLTANQTHAATRGTIRQGAALLAGLVICAKCNVRMLVSYGGSTNQPLYCCTRKLSNYGTTSCQRLAGPGLDQWVSQQTLAALTPAALALSLEAAQRVEQERGEVGRVWQHRLERATYEADRASRQYHQVEPEHRLVARQLEREWEEKLAVHRRLQDEYERFAHSQPQRLSATEREAIHQLAMDLPALWAAPTTSIMDRKEILRQVVARVVIDVQGKSERVQVRVEWVGGAITAGEIIRPVQRWEQLSYYPQLCTRVVALASEKRSAACIAAQLNTEGYRPAKQVEQFGPQGVLGLLRKIGYTRPQSPVVSRSGLEKHEWWLPELARRIGMPVVTLYGWLQRGWVTGRHSTQGSRRCIVWADAAEVERLRQRHLQPSADKIRARWPDVVADTAKDD